MDDAPIKMHTAACVTSGASWAECGCPVAPLPRGPAPTIGDPIGQALLHLRNHRLDQLADDLEARFAESVAQVARLSDERDRAKKQIAELSNAPIRAVVEDYLGIATDRVPGDDVATRIDLMLQRLHADHERDGKQIAELSKRPDPTEWNRGDKRWAVICNALADSGVQESGRMADELCHALAEVARG